MIRTRCQECGKTKKQPDTFTFVGCVSDERGIVPILCTDCKHKFVRKNKRRRRFRRAQEE